MTDGEKNAAAISDAADLVLKGGGILVFAGAVAVAALKASNILLLIMMGATSLVLLTFAMLVFGVAVMKVEDGLFKQQRISLLGGSAIGLLLVVLIVFSTMGLVIDLASGLTVN